MALQQLDSDAIEGLLRRPHLNQDVVTRVMLSDQALNASQLPLDSLQAIQDAPLH
jgi:hypothetical protein